jgi:hypothetical protein
MTFPRRVAMRLLVAAVALAAATPARAIPAFARKYGTSCLTCHTVYPKLTPFGEAFRRNGYRFPGVDSDYVKQETVPLGQEANKKTFPNTVWPATIPGSLPVGIGFNGSLRTFPDQTATDPRANNGRQFSFDDLVAEGHLWLGASLSDTLTLWGEVTMGDGEPISVEHAQVLFNDLVGPAHYVNLVVGKGFVTLSSFGPHSSYAADVQIPSLPVTAMAGTGTAGAVTPLGAGLNLLDSFKGIEVNGVIQGRFNYALGLTGSNDGLAFNSENWYASAGYKLGGMRLDGEGETGPKDSMKPWAEDAFTIHGFVFHSNEHFADATGVGAFSNDVSFTAGIGARAQYGSAELDLGYYSQSNSRGTVVWDPVAGAAVYSKVTGDVTYGELSYVVYPWLVPVLRVENLGLKPQGGSRVSDLHVMPAIAFLIRPNMKLVVAANIESANGFPTAVDPATGNLTPLAWQGGSADWGPISIGPKPTSLGTTKLMEFESLNAFFAWAL